VWLLNIQTFLLEQPKFPILVDPMRDVSKCRNSEFSGHFIRKCVPDTPLA
jgi:hypothetical protein